MMKKNFFTLAACLLISPSLHAESKLRSHDAIYAMKQVNTYGERNSPVDNAQGVLRYRFRNVCDGYTVEHNTAMLMGDENQQVAQLNWSYTSWEAKDGSRLRFHSRSKQNGQLTEEYSGEAMSTGMNPSVIYKIPQGRHEALPKGVYFPTTHLVKSVELAEKGEVIFNAPYFDGSGEDLAFEVNLVMTPFKGKPLAAVEGVSLAKVPTWEMKLAFYEMGNGESLPQMEIGARYRKDGVATRLVQDFGEFILEGQLVEFSYQAEPDCSK